MPAVPALIPKPARLEATGGDPFVISESTTVVVNGRPDLIGIAVLAADLLGRVTGRSIEIRYAESDAPDVVRLRLTTADGEGDESYKLVSNAGRVDLEARSPAGLVRAIVTLRQLLTTAPDGSLRVPAVVIEDAPRYAWRGLSIDVARHFVAKRDLKVIIGLMAHYKLNVLHLHLTDDQGWRLQVRSRPQLTRLSSGTSVNGDPGGFYTADDYADIVAFASVRGVRVVPEIDVPGHVNAATHAYGNLTPSGEPTDVYTGIEVGFSRLYADLPATGDFLREVFADVAEMTPGDYVHIGGDEVLTMEPAEYATLVAAASDAVRAAGKKVVGWQEIASTPLEPGTVVQYWDTRVDPAPFVAAAEAGALLLMSPGSKAYLDMKYDASTPLGLEWAGHIELRDAYDWEPSTLVPGVPAESVIGVEAAIWTETLRDLPALTSMLLPRLAAIAEVAWTEPEQRDWEDFRTRVVGQGPFWDRLGLSWYRSPQVDWR
ncbi:beta-N-acetylhexosaminidase [Cellulomonas sp. URHE0023]|uniref:beta-N-acetylhexosaminidase n=1 Tax=Cellulomonas sp. URHE0023 TaxID=1380354 RepID=UPI0004818951|nr:beta-N-acetylhexosaminidase [Cellulomonas sp. URHE0023]